MFDLPFTRRTERGLWENDIPIRGELFGIERLEEHARSLAQAQSVATRRSGDRRLAARLAENHGALHIAHARMASALAAGSAITPAAEWLLDNFHLVEARIDEIRADLPPGYYRLLPKLADGPLAGYPRVFGAAWAFVAHTDSRCDPIMLGRFLRAYQEVEPLTIGELWAVALTLSIVLVENLRRLADGIITNRDARQAADDLADRLLAAEGHGADSISAILKSVANTHVPLSFTVELVHRLRDHGPRLAPAVSWLDEQLAARCLTADEAVRTEQHRQGAMNVTVRNIITSMRQIAELDWQDFVESISLVDAALSDGTDFQAMDFATRNLYRSAIETLARNSPHRELEIARQAVAKGRQWAERHPLCTDLRQKDAGYYLIAGGRRAFASQLGVLRRIGTLSSITPPAGIAIYVAACTALACCFLALPLILLAARGVTANALLVLGMVGALPAIDASVAVVNRIVSLLVGATPLPSMALPDGIPASLRTLVVVPMLLTSRQAIAQQIERLEVHALASARGDLHFALLSDWLDSTVERDANDDLLFEAAATGIDLLNSRYGATGDGSRFLLLHRKRTWSDSEGKWIGWERKRGKLHELNSLLRGARGTNFICNPGSSVVHVPTGIKYIITLDSDTRLPRDTVCRLIGKMAHPLNSPRLDAASGRVVEGYAILQPRVTPSLPVGKEGSLFQRMFSGLSGIDPYASASSDVYQDLLGEGSYAGKGIYDIDAFEWALKGRVPAATLLSHDLFEGVFARAGLASDIEVVEEFPARYDVASKRHHRWARGDWQLLPWILGIQRRPRGADAESAGVPATGRLKMLDNLRRTAAAPSAIASLFAGWSMPLQTALTWTAFTTAVILLPAFLPALGAILPRRPRITRLSKFRSFATDARYGLALGELILTFLPHQAWLMFDAIARTMYRLLVSRRHLLEWETAARANSAKRLSIGGFYLNMMPAPLFGMFALGLADQGGHAVLALVLPFAALWVVSPAIARWTSLSPLVADHVSLSAPERAELRLLARRTWRFFETFVTETDNMLPPDNFQEDPQPVIAHRTSPTNIGLYLLSVVTARDFAWIGTIDAVTRLEDTMGTLRGLTKYRGHLYNWYDTTDLRPLDPPYISSVDSGNLAGHLVAVATTCREWREHPPEISYFGVIDAVDMLLLEVERLSTGTSARVQSLSEIKKFAVALSVDVAGSQRNLSSSALPDDPPLAPYPPPSTIDDIARNTARLTDMVASFTLTCADDCGGELLYWAEAAGRTIAAQRKDSLDPETSATLKARLSTLETAARSMAMSMEFGFLINTERQLLSIGYQVTEAALDSSCYDLLASEARLASFLAIAKCDIGARHWFRLGRPVVALGDGAALLSWSGSMFEYLMPSLVMRAPAGSILEQTNRLIVARQIAYGVSLGSPWGVSESAYNARDLEFTYQYSNFGVPGLGLKRGLADNQVIAPYATVLAAMIDPHAAVLNLRRLVATGALGQFGYYDALDYTAARRPAGRRVVLVKTYMAHHQGMSIVAVGNILLDGIMRARFHAEPMIQATELLLQERAPRDIAVTPLRLEDEALTPKNGGVVKDDGLRRVSPHSATPSTLLLSNGRYSVMLSASGGGYSNWLGHAVTRWRPDTTCDDQGSYIFLRNVTSGAIWAAALQPVAASAARYSVEFSESCASFKCDHGDLTTTMDVFVSPEDDGEVRRVTIVNNGSTRSEIEVTSYAELVLGMRIADEAHPAFSKLFVETEYLSERGCLLATRRRREPAETEVWCVQFSVVDGAEAGDASVETDRLRFVGRGNDIGGAVAVVAGGELSSTVGTVLDAVFALRRRICIDAGETVTVAFWTMVAGCREAAIALVEKHGDVAAFSRAQTLSWTQSQMELRHLGISPGEATLFQALASHLLYPSAMLRPLSTAIACGLGPQADLWAHGISGDLPILLVRIGDIEFLDMPKQVLRAHEYLRLRGLAFDLVILNERAFSYQQDIQDALESAVHVSVQQQATPGSRPIAGRVFILRGDLVCERTRALLSAVAYVVLIAEQGGLAEQMGRTRSFDGHMVRHVGRLVDRDTTAPPGVACPLEFFNGLGGFDEEGKSYTILGGPGQITPAPWINVVANAAFGFEVGASGGGSTWAINSRENRLTPWSNDPVCERSGEAFYLRDNHSGALWTATAAPIRNPESTYRVCHGRGFTRFVSSAYGIRSELVQFVPLADPIKISRLRISNGSAQTRRLSLTGYVEWVLSASRSVSQVFIATSMDVDSNAMFARNSWSSDFGGQVSFADFSGKQTDWTGDRCEFIGRNGSLANPIGLTEEKPFSNRTGAGFDPCTAMRTQVEIRPGGSVELVFLLGQGANVAEARALLKFYRAADLDAVQNSVAEFWAETLETVQVSTPDRSLDIMLNGWLLYQTLACRMWARSAFYQSSGAYGFRDQLQDGMALASVRPTLTRDHLVRAAGRQFLEGDVQHWWLPHSGQGVRTRISDDRVWLAYAVAHYVNVTADFGVLAEPVAFLEGAVLAESDSESFSLPGESKRTESLYEHCALALDRSLANGNHGLPLMGTGDWNDGMNRVGHRGRGESVWLGWFLHATLTAFEPLARQRNELSRIGRWGQYKQALTHALDENGWDGGWYRRGYFDDGTPLGSSSSDACRIDAIAQSWAVLSSAAPRDRAVMAMGAMAVNLIRSSEGLALLLTPPFDKSIQDPGYIKAYPPGIRENGGQYTHAAVWSVMALAALGDGDGAWRLWAMLNPINHSRNGAEVYRYKVEPYVVAADIYSEAPHIGRGGWTWYTGAAGWMQRAGIESILGLRIAGEVLELNPCIPRLWAGFSMSVRFRSARYDIVVDNPDKVMKGICFVELDGVVVNERPVRLNMIDDGGIHHVLLRLG